MPPEIETVPEAAPQTPVTENPPIVPAAPVTPEPVVRHKRVLLETVLIRHKRVVAPKNPAAPKKKKKKVAIKEMSSADFQQNVLEALYALRRDQKTRWVDLVNATKEGARLEQLLKKQPSYTWVTSGAAHYLQSRHTDEEVGIAYITPHDPMESYRDAKFVYEDQLKRFNALPKAKQKKIPVKPEAPKSKKLGFVWHIIGKRGLDYKSGHAATIVDAKMTVMGHQKDFLV